MGGPERTCRQMAAMERAVLQQQQRGVKSTLQVLVHPRRCSLKCICWFLVAAGDDNARRTLQPLGTAMGIIIRHPATKIGLRTLIRRREGNTFVKRRAQRWGS